MDKDSKELVETVLSTSEISKNVAILKFTPEKCKDLLSDLTLNLASHSISKPVYFDFLIDCCVVEPVALLKPIVYEREFYNFVEMLVQEICKINPSLNYRKLYVTPRGLLRFSPEPVEGLYKVTENMDWDFPAIVFKYSHNSFVNIKDINYRENFIVHHAPSDSYVIVKHLDEMDVNHLYKMKENLPANAYKKYFCYYSILNFYYVYSALISFSGREIPEVYDEMYRMILKVNPSPFIKRLIQNQDDVELSDEGIDINDYKLAGTILNKNIPPGDKERKKKKDKKDITRKQEREFKDVNKDDIKELHEALHDNIYGQDEAIDLLVAAVKRAKVGLRREHAPVLSAMFTGPTGTGKTECSKILAKYLTKDSDAFIRIDCSEYTASHEVSKLFGAPPGYIGHDEGGQLVTKVMEYPFSIVLFDEIEKAHPRLYDTLLQVMDAGRMTDGHGNVANFGQTILLFTSNLGSKDISEAQSPMGFGSSASSASDDSIKKIVNNSLKKHFRPEFLGRMDDVIVFKQLTDETCKKIVGKELEHLSHLLKVNNNIDSNFDESVIDFLVHEGFSKEYGARPVIKTVKKYVSDKIADTLIENEDATSVLIYMEDGEVTVKDVSSEEVNAEIS